MLSEDDGSDDTIACENGGTPNGGRCTCPTGFEGIRCEKRKFWAMLDSKTKCHSP